MDIGGLSNSLKKVKCEINPSLHVTIQHLTHCPNQLVVGFSFIISTLNQASSMETLISVLSERTFPIKYLMSREFLLEFVTLSQDQKPNKKKNKNNRTNIVYMPGLILLNSFHFTNTFEITGLEKISFLLVSSFASLLLLFFSMFCVFSF